MKIQNEDFGFGTKQLKTVIAKENLKKPKQTQKKTSEQIVFVGL